MKLTGTFLSYLFGFAAVTVARPTGVGSGTPSLTESPLHSPPNLSVPSSSVLPHMVAVQLPPMSTPLSSDLLDLQNTFISPSHDNPSAIQASVTSSGSFPTPTVLVPTTISWVTSGLAHTSPIGPLIPPPPTNPPSILPNMEIERSLTTFDLWPVSSDPYAGHPLPTTSSSAPHMIAKRSPPNLIASGVSAPELFGYFLDIPHTSHPRNITVPKGVCQEADRGNGVPKDANFIELFIEHWCEFYSVSNDCDPKTDPTEHKRLTGPITNIDISQYQGRDYRCGTTT